MFIKIQIYKIVCLSLKTNKKKPKRLPFPVFIKLQFKKNYLVIRSSHLSINNMVAIEIKQATTNTDQVIQIGMRS